MRSTTNSVSPSYRTCEAATRLVEDSDAIQTRSSRLVSPGQSDGRGKRRPNGRGSPTWWPVSLNMHMISPATEPQMQCGGALYAATMRAVAPPSRDSSMSALACSKTGTATRDCVKIMRVRTSRSFGDARREKRCARMRPVRYSAPRATY